MNFLTWLTVLGSAGMALGGISVQRAGWLDRVVDYYKQRFVDDVRRVAPVQIRASLERAPPGYTDTAPWDYESVARLLALLGASEAAAPVRRALRRALRPDAPTRRFISKQQSWKLFPSLGLGHPNEIYYDFNDYEAGGDSDTGALFDTWDEGAVLVVQNPVEARLPGRQISVGLLKQILQSRAVAARMMPSTARSTIGWISVNTSETATDGAAGNDSNSTDAGAGAGTDATGAAANPNGEATTGGAGGAPAAGDGGAAATDASAGGNTADGAAEAEPTEPQIQKLSKRKEKKDGNKPRLRPGDDSPPPLRKLDQKGVKKGAKKDVPKKEKKIAQESVPEVLEESVPKVGQKSIPKGGQESVRPKVAQKRVPKVGQKSVPKVDQRSTPKVGLKNVRKGVAKKTG